MTGFDITTLSGFNPARYACSRCWALVGLDPNLSKCPKCQAIRENSNSWLNVTAPDNGQVSFDHARRLASIAQRLRAPEDHAPLNLLYEALLTARRFVHFVTFTISDEILGALKLASLIVPVRGIVGMAKGKEVRDKLSRRAAEAPRFELRLPAVGAASDELPHSKLIVIDGLITITGSPNLTIEAWEKIGARREHLDVITDTESVKRLHNDQFSTNWLDLEVTLDEVPTFALVDLATNMSVPNAVQSALGSYAPFFKS